MSLLALIFAFMLLKGFLMLWETFEEGAVRKRKPYPKLWTVADQKEWEKTMDHGRTIGRNGMVNK